MSFMQDVQFKYKIIGTVLFFLIKSADEIHPYKGHYA